MKGHHTCKGHRFNIVTQQPATTDISALANGTNAVIPKFRTPQKGRVVGHLRVL
jgi:hypothetical protein